MKVAHALAALVAFILTVSGGKAVAADDARIVAECPVCTAQYDPVCGLDPDFGFLTFSNACVMRQHNCMQATHYSFYSKGECDNAEYYGKK